MKGTVDLQKNMAYSLLAVKQEKQAFLQKYNMVRLDDVSTTISINFENS